MSFELSRQALRRRAYNFSFALKARHRANFRVLNAAQKAELAAANRAHYKNVTDEGDLDQALEGALAEDRLANVPWLDAAFPLDGARILEIGAGTGESTLALAEQGAVVTGVDVDEGALAAGRERCRIYGLKAEFVSGNAADAARQFAGRTYDMVIFFASLEHMTHEERFQAMTGTWGLLRPGGIWCVIEAPNRLWFWDGHTSMDNFYNWLPDEIAQKWAHRASRPPFAADFPAGKAFDPVALARWGRGVSFHEFDLAFGDARGLDVISDKSGFLRRSNPLLFAHSLVSKARRYERFLASITPGIHPGFFRQYLDLAVRKPR